MPRLACAILALLAPVAVAQPVINEIMASNLVTLTDQDGESSDWIEIRNTGAAPINLLGWFLTDSATQLTKWQFPSTPLAAGGYLVVFASEKNRAVLGQQLHTNFKLADGGDYLALVQPDGVTIASSIAPQYPPQHADISWGFAGTSTTTRVYSSNPTPGAANGPGTTVVVDHQATPAAPGDSDPITISVSVIPAPGATINQVILRHRVNYGAETIALMALVGGRYQATIPPSTSLPGDMVRWRITATDSLVQTARDPLFRVAGNSPEYHGRMIAIPSVVSPLRTLFWFVQSPSAAATTGGTRCSLWYGGEFYDNVDVRLRGGSSAAWPKVSYKFDFNTGFHFRFDPAEERVEEMNLNSAWGDKSFLRNILSYELYTKAGASASLCFPMRIQQNKNFHSVASFVEQPDHRLVARLGLDPKGALYKMYNECTSATVGVEKQTRLSEGTADLAALVAGIQLSGTALDAYLFDNVDLPAVISYLVATCLIHDNDHVAKNYYLWRDSDGDREWRFLPWDKDLTWGRNYTLNGGVLNDTIWANVDPYSHPLFADQQHPKNDGPWNRLVDACYRSPRVQQMYLRRLRSVMDAELQAPGTPAAQLRIEARIAQLQTLMNADCALDQALWGVPSYGNTTLNFTNASNEIATAYLGPRRVHLYTTHGSGPQALVPPAQVSNPQVRITVIEPSPSAPLEGYVQLYNCSTTAVDVSRWVIFGTVTFVIPPGTVIPALDSVYVVANPNAFRARAVSPRGGEGRLVVGPWNGTLTTSNASINLMNEFFQLVDTSGNFSFSVTTGGTGDVNLAVAGTAPSSELWTLVSLQTTTPLGCGPLLGLGADAFTFFLFPPNTPPFRVTTGPSGVYSFSAPAGTITPGLTIDARAIARSPAGVVQFSAIRRVTF